MLNPINIKQLSKSMPSLNRVANSSEPARRSSPQNDRVLPEEKLSITFSGPKLSRAQKTDSKPETPAISTSNSLSSNSNSAPVTLTVIEETPKPEKQKLKRYDVADMRAAQETAKAQGTKVLTMVNGNSVFQVNVHGAKGKEFDRVGDALKALVKQDEFGLIVPHLKDVFLTDSLGLSRNGKTSVQGTSFEQKDGATSILLSRVTEQKADSRLLEKGAYVKRLLYHELGHVVDNQYRLSSTSGVFGKGQEQDFVSPYAAVNAKEDFAETFAEFYVAATDTPGSTRTEISQLMNFGQSESYKAKISGVAEGLKPELEVHRQALREVQDSGVSPKSFVGSYHEDADFKSAWQTKLRKSNPQLPQAAIDRQMAHLQKILG